MLPRRLLLYALVLLLGCGVQIGTEKGEGGKSKGCDRGADSADTSSDSAD